MNTQLSRRCGVLAAVLSIGILATTSDSATAQEPERIAPEPREPAFRGDADCSGTTTPGATYYLAVSGPLPGQTFGLNWAE